jgi:glycosyltransferase involved in cell wall biosynthesis
MRFSVITPSFQNSEWLKLCVASVADQGVEHEHIVQDAGSNDGTLDWLPNDPRVRAFVEEDSGMYDAINRGLRKSTGDVIAYLNCDEQYLPGALSAAAEYFEAHPDRQVVFADAVAVNTSGEYLWHRKMLRPLLWHTWSSPLSVLTCATFFRRSILDDERLFFDPRWKYVGDSAWVLRLLQNKVRAGILRRFTSVFTHTGANLSLHENALREAKDFYGTASGLIRLLHPAILLHHRVRRWLGGIYSQPPFSFQLYTQASPQVRAVKHAIKPTYRWRW